MRDALNGFLFTESYVLTNICIKLIISSSEANMEIYPYLYLYLYLYLYISKLKKILFKEVMTFS